MYVSIFPCCRERVIRYRITTGITHNCYSYYSNLLPVLLALPRAATRSTDTIPYM